MSTKDFKLLAQRVAQLQAKVDALEAGVVSAPGSKVKVRATSTNLDDSLATEKAEGSAPTSPLSPRTGVASRRHVGDDEMVFALEDLHFRHGVNTLRNIDASPGVGTHRLDPASMAWGGSGVVGDDAGSVQSRLTDDHPLAFLIPPDSDYLAMALHVLPDQPTCEFLVQQYFGNLEWFQRVSSAFCCRPSHANARKVSPLPNLFPPMSAPVGPKGVYPRNVRDLTRLCRHVHHGRVPRLAHGGRLAAGNEWDACVAAWNHKHTGVGGQAVPCGRGEYTSIEAALTRPGGAVVFALHASPDL